MSGDDRGADVPLDDHAAGLLRAGAGPLVLPPFAAGAALDRYRALVCRAFWLPPALLPRRAPGSAELAAGRGRGAPKRGAGPSPSPW